MSHYPHYLSTNQRAASIAITQAKIAIKILKYKLIDTPPALRINQPSQKEKRSGVGLRTELQTRSTQMNQYPLVFRQVRVLRHPQQLILMQVKSLRFGTREHIFQKLRIWRAAHYQPLWISALDHRRIEESHPVRQNTLSSQSH
ncbi:hypothetical protein TNCV_3053891 [Trichonephila clavipes]|nr:hypothetical protein TNCV_3053891 [Trichonephila clavipes]